MKKRIVVAAMVALMGVGGYLGYRAMTRTNAGESDLLLTNAEALARDETSLEFDCFWHVFESENPFIEYVYYTHKCLPCGTPVLVKEAWDGGICKIQ